ncbi:MAG: succinate dehydrogenase, hydrophobic membrane anchor protein [Phycisphaerae bacterium]
MRSEIAATQSGGALGWLLQRFTGALLAVLLLTHFFVTHFSAGGDRSFQQVSARLHQPLWQAAERLFLAAALWHGGYGLWLMIQDYVSNSLARLILLMALWTVGAVAFVLGWLTIIALGGPAR